MAALNYCRPGVVWRTGREDQCGRCDRCGTMAARVLEAQFLAGTLPTAFAAFCFCSRRLPAVGRVVSCCSCPLARAFPPRSLPVGHPRFPPDLSFPIAIAHRIPPSMPGSLHFQYCAHRQAYRHQNRPASAFGRYEGDGANCQYQAEQLCAWASRARQWASSFARHRSGSARPSSAARSGPPGCGRHGMRRQCQDNRNDWAP